MLLGQYAEISSPRAANVKVLATASQAVRPGCDLGSTPVRPGGRRSRGHALRIDGDRRLRQVVHDNGVAIQVAP